MAKREQNQLLFWIKVTFIGASLPLLLSHQSWAIDCTKTNDINLKIEEFKDKDTKKVDAAIDDVVNCGENAIAPLRLALSEDEAAIRAKAALALGEMGAIAQDVAPVLVDTLEDREATVRTEALSALIQIGQAVKNQPESEFNWWNLSAIEDIEALKQSLETALTKIEKEKEEKKWTSKEIEELRRLTKIGLSTKLETLTDRRLYQVRLWVQHNPWVGLPAGYLILYLGIFIIHPIWLLKLDEWVKPATFKIPIINLPVSLRYLVWLKYNPRVLNAWVKENLDQAVANFQDKDTVIERKIYIPVPVTLDGKTIPELSGKDLHSIFQKKRVCLLISGEGGAGKTSLACQIAKWTMADEADQRLCQHQMIPVLIEQELQSQDLIGAIRGQLQALINSIKPLSEELLDNLLRQCRLLVIVDHLSEMSEDTRQKIQPNSPNFSVNALIVTSRLEEKEKLGGVNKTEIKPLRVEGNRLSKFMDAYLEEKGKRASFDDEEYFDACRRLSRMVGERNITLLLARMYADQLIYSQEGTLGYSLPENIPELMLCYLNKLNRTVDKSHQCKELSVHRSAKVVAWECLKQTYQPSLARSKDVVESLTASFKETEDTEAPRQKAEDRLHYLEKRLRLIQTVEPGDKVRFVLDPLAEYLAALCLVEYCRDSEKKWNEFLTTVDDIQGSLDAIQGFLLAVRDCCLVKQKELNILDFVPEELGKKAGLDPQAIQAAQRKQRVRKLIEELDAPEKKYRLRAINDLAAMGKDANIAIPKLYKVLERDSEVAEIRAKGLKTLKQLKADEHFFSILSNILEKDNEVLEIRLEALETLKHLKADESFFSILSNILEKDNEVLEIRLEAFKSLKQLRADNNLIPIFENKADGELISFSVIESPDTVKIDLGNGVTLDMVSIPGGSFMMGSPEGQGYDTEKPEHKVTVQAFLMGKYPVTQKQWRAITSLPKVKHNLHSNPSNFKGDNLPVEKVSWEDAVEFCQRLSKQTGREYRLPTEAEWEYACRSRTTTPFHFGETITGDLANYNASVIYANEPKGEYREKTTPVGSFSPNAFGLYDMHGNVWEWCEDDWHDNYEGAPTDGSAWLSGTSNIKVVRGGSWLNLPRICRSAYRINDNPRYHIYGFRVACGVA